MGGLPGLRRFLPRGDVRKEVSEEIESHLEMRARDLMMAGMPPDEARREAVRRFGRPDVVERDCITARTKVRRRERRIDLMDGLRQDLRMALRSLLRRRRTTAVAVLTLALAIGGNTAVFSVLNSVLLEPLPYPEADRLVQVVARNPDLVTVEANPRRDRGFPASDFLELRERNTVFTSMGWAVGGTTIGLNLEGDGSAGERVVARPVSASLFEVLGTRPIVGRLWTEDEETFAPVDATVTRVVLLSHSFWVRRYGSDPSIVGRTITLNANPHVVVGVLPPEGRPPPLRLLGETVALDADVYLPPTTTDVFALPPNVRPMVVVARLRPGVTTDQASAEMASIAAGLEEQYPETHQGWTAAAVSLQGMLNESYGLRLGLLMGAVGLVLLIACANVANLLSAEGATRVREMAVRSSLGGARLRLVRQLFTESLVLAGVAGALGLLLAYPFDGILTSLVPASMPRAAETTIDGRAVAFTVAVSLMTTVLFGLLPAFRGSRVDIADVIKGMPAGRGWSHRRWGGADGLVATQITLTLVLLVGAGLVGRSFLQQGSVDLGFDTSNLLTVEMHPSPPSIYNSALSDCGFETGQRCRRDNEAIARVYEDALEAVRSVPGVLSASVVDWPPLLPSFGGPLGTEVFSETATGACVGRGVTSPWRQIQTGYRATMRIPLLSGRDLNAADEVWTQVLISQSLSERLWPGEDPLGRRLGIWEECGWIVVGVVADVRSYVFEDRVQYGGGGRLDAAIYLKGVDGNSSTIVARVAGPPMSFVEPIRSVLEESGAPPPVFEAMDERSAAQYATPRFYAQVLGLFALFALVLAAVGLYGTVALTVSRSTREIGIRMALGARATRITRMVFGRSARSVLLGVVLGGSISVLGVRVIEGFLYGMDPVDPVTFAIVAAVLAAAVAVATYLPTRRATNVDPVAALRSD